MAALAALSIVAGTAWAGFAGTGVDVSSYQHVQALNWSKAKADGVTFAFIKATEGRTYTNPYFAGDWAACANLGIYRGAYHFALPSKGTAAAQARYFVKVAGLQRGSGVLPPVLDLEKTGGLGVRALRTWTATWLQTVQDLTGRDPMIYVSPYFWKTYLGNSKAFTEYPLWIAEYGVRAPEVPGGWSTWSFWQSTSSGRINGIAGHVDVDRWNGDAAHLALMANVTDGSTPPSTTGTTSPSPVPTTLTVAVNKPAVYADTPVTFTGALNASGAAVSGRRVSLWQQPQGTTTWTRIGLTTTDTTGRYTFTRTPTGTASYFVKWGGNATYAPTSSPTQTVTLLQPATSTLSLASSRSLVYPGQDSLFSGRLGTATAPLVGKTVWVWKQRAGATRWRRVGSATTTSTGAFSLRVTPTVTASYVARWRGGTAYLAAESTPVSVTYQPTIPTTVTLHLSRRNAYAGQRVAVSGTLSSPVGALTSQSVELYQQGEGDTEPTLAATLSTDRSGAFAVALGTTATTTYTVRYAGTSPYEPAAADPATVTLLPPHPTTLSLTSRHDSIRAGRQLALRGHLLTDGQGLANRRIRVFRRFFGDSTWHRVRVTRTQGSHGYWAVTVRHRQGAVYRAVYSGAMRFEPAQSPGLRVRVH
ncbi:MAG TPA: GH25 family lysozyme [Nocardioidaceae bacterium]|nr:GH25 family lysozyme [Nocardioidaceae bacterium]